MGQMNRQPIIGVTPLVDAAKESYWMLPGYFNGILQAGGLPLMLPLTTDASRIAQLCHLCDGILLTGGQDIQPELYGAEPLPCCGECSPERDTMELQLLELAFHSYHHQGILKLAEALQPMAVAPDGLIESVWLPEKAFVWGVQWHPEYDYQKNVASQQIFQAFVQASGKQEK